MTNRATTPSNISSRRDILRSSTPGSYLLIQPPECGGGQGRKTGTGYAIWRTPVTEPLAAVTEFFSSLG